MQKHNLTFDAHLFSILHHYAITTRMAETETLRNLKVKFELQERSGSSVPPILNRMETFEDPPTYNRTNKFTYAFQNLIDAYGVANYREVNPSKLSMLKSVMQILEIAKKKLCTNLNFSFLSLSLSLSLSL